MSNLIPFIYEGQEMRTVVIDGDPWWVGKDVCEYFADTNYRRSLSRLDDDEKGVSQIDTPGGVQQMTIINESGLYSLLFAMQPQKGNLPEEQYKERIEQIKTFRRWVTHEVIPQIRKTGAYAPAPVFRLPQNYGEALRELANVWEEKEQLKEQNALMAPKAEFFDAVADSKDAIDIGSAAKVLNCGIGRTKLFKFLRDSQVLMKNNVPYQEFIDRGYFRVIEQKYSKPDGTNCINTKTLVYQRGLNYIRKLLDNKLQLA